MTFGITQVPLVPLEPTLNEAGPNLTNFTLNGFRGESLSPLRLPLDVHKNHRTKAVERQAAKADNSHRRPLMALRESTRYVFP